MKVVIKVALVISILLQVCRRPQYENRGGEITQLMYLRLLMHVLGELNLAYFYRYKLNFCCI